MIRFERQNGAYRMHHDGSDVVAVHQVLRTMPGRPVAAVLRELTPGSIFVAEQAPAPNTYLREQDALDPSSLFPYRDTLGGEFSGDRLTLIIREILAGRSRTEPIDDELPVAYCVRSGVIDEVHVETARSERERYRALMGTVTFYDRPLRAHASRSTSENRERL